MSRKKLIAIDLFAGAGGLSEGLRQAGFRVVAAVENDPVACRTYRLNHPRVRLWEKDIRRVSGTRVLRDLKLKQGQLDLLAACPPCQGFSTMRTRNGTCFNRDERNELIFDVLRMVKRLRPKSVMLENVPGLVANQRFTTFTKALTRLGYHVQWAILNAADYGVPQNRRRLILLASKRRRPGFASKVKNSRTVRQCISKLPAPDRSRDPLHNYSVCRSKKVLDIIRRIPHDGGSRRSLGSRRQLACHQRFVGFWDVYGRMGWDGFAPTITGGCINPSKGRFVHPEADRAITLREAALLQSFPKSYRFSMEAGRYSVALLIGNAFPPEFIRRHALSLKRAI